MLEIQNITDDELDEIIQLVNNVLDFDFSNYSKASLKRRFQRLLLSYKWDIADLKIKITNQPKFLDFLLQEITVNVTEMFRDPEFFKILQNKVLPYIATYQRIKIWNAGVSTGEELYSFAILFEASSLYQKSFFYGTDINSKVIEVAKSGIYPLKDIKSYAENFNKTSIDKPFTDFFTVQYQNAIINSELRKNSLFSIHNLVSDGIFNEFQLVSCRNVLIYFDQELQKKVIKLLIDSLCLFGFLCLGSKEVIRSQELLVDLKVIDAKYNIFQKIR